ncbi:MULTISPECIES: UvrD-helicase domain-containing protein [Klebsiella]|nr:MULTISPECIES: UvrD-helicase domain-containing protein [Klebsiella]HDU5096064.1 UvrD-helicase domain-containing protein [Klebsiella pneumoniae subsp. ozaenae]EIY1432286.1 UvrD-helicase domain-containing protein [Klebsiella pneumoniae]EIY5072694.1 UvrD-helicase domain-containing protein [Klebsiella quasipneumoniae]EKZ6453401.1 UvrD-helicase domain-containing protein [Klebsiella pneumoniae]ELA2451238.1 UvrD-helicase domain-containing protein [Klebsiella pneumoniae]
MNFIAIESNAARKIVSERMLQSADYDKGQILARLLKDGKISDFSLDIKALSINSGIYILSKNPNKKNLLIFDTTTFNGFQRSSSEVVTILQKSCRLAIKLWDKIGHSPCEKIINGTSLIALLPLSFTTGKSYKVILDKSPDKERQEKRNESSFLIFQDGYDTAENEPKLANFRKAKEGFLEIDPLTLFKSSENQSDPSSSYLSVSEIHEAGNLNNPHMGLDYWTKNLTESQKKFVFSESFGPDILKGAAGTGKTLSLILRSVVQLKNAKKTDNQLRAIFITHSIATKNNIENLIASNGGDEFINSGKLQSIEVTTLQEWCINNLGNRISATEYLDSDALESKQLQLLYINEALEDFFIKDYAGSLNFISPKLKKFFGNNDPWGISILLQEEISTYIKGRAGDDLKTYMSLPRTKNIIPIENDDDFKTIFSIYNKYQEKLIALNLFDSDDITLSALKETSTPIWKRRRMTAGFDIMYIDETHLFNINELSLFHNLLKPNSNHIVFTMDRSQATGDTTITKEDVAKELDANLANEHGLSAVFRSSEHIINLASCVLASGATLFQELENPLAESMTGHTSLIEDKCCVPYIITKQNASEVYRASFSFVDHIAQELDISKSDVLIVPCTDQVFKELKNFAESNDKEYISIERRGDNLAVEAAATNNLYVIGGMDYIGGLEFSVVVIVGADSDKFPEQSTYTGESLHFINYSSFNKLYVAITRAKYQIAFIAEKTQKISPLLETAVTEGLLTYNDELSNRL